MKAHKPRTHTSYRLSTEARLLLANLAGYHGITRTAVLEMLIRRAARTLEKRP